MFLPRPARPVLLFHFIRLVTALQQLGSHETAILLPSTTSQTHLSSNTSLSSVIVTALPGLEVQCDGATYGYNPNIVDCEDAKEYLTPDTKEYTFGQRHTGLSDDSECTGRS